MFFWIFVFFVFGSAVGSFLNVVIDRTTRGESILGRSYCDHCKATLQTFDLLPIVSFVTLGARCRYCKKSLSWQYPLVETITALLFVFVFLVLTIGGQLTTGILLYYFFLVSTLLVVAIIDLKFSLIPTTLVFFASFVSLFYNYFYFSSWQFVEHVLAAFATAIFFLIIVLATRGRGMGEGDIILGFLIGMIVGIKGAILAIFAAFLVGAVVSLFLIFCGKKKFGQTIPFAPFLALGLLISLFWAKPIIEWYLMLY